MERRTGAALFLGFELLALVVLAGAAFLADAALGAAFLAASSFLVAEAFFAGAALVDLTLLADSNTQA